ncbi:BLOC-1-related complex subunit 5-like [Saccoglossus kowalevskii]|uniref:BLOC-1-related complex subunit 5 n=1 Tax=Saccoglossus kowalevskii TaxID=10224 RepID=A0ABM0GN99_SACKO|nr:PREDICTED: loss of heterozygosity 12 chromosomal region 1 protein-like [Saccoglossus kowalevskii]
MGTEQSTDNNSQSNRDKDQETPPPYTSYSVDRQQSQQDAPKEKLSQDPANAGVNSKSIPQAKLEDIVVVRMAQKDNVSMNSELEKLHDIPTFLPIMRGALNIPNMEDPNVLDKIDSKQALLLCVRYQEHMKQCAEAVSFDQNALAHRIKEVDVAIHSIMHSMVERQKKFAKYAEHIQKIEEMSAVLKRVQMSVDQLVPLMDRLNSVLPDEDRLEPFSMRPEKKIN